MRLSAEEEKRIRNESSTMIYRGDHDAAFAYKADIAALFAELDAVRAELKQAQCANQELRDLNVAGKKLGDWIDLTSKLAAAESRAERFSSSLDNVRNEAKKNARRAEQWERKFNDDGPRCKVRTDSKEGRFIAPTDCGKEDLEQRLARVKEISRGNCADCSESMLGQLGGFTRIGEYRCYYCKAWFCGDHAFAHFDDHDKGQQRRISELEQRLAMARKIIINQPHARLCNCSFAVAVCNCWKAAALKELEGK